MSTEEQITAANDREQAVVVAERILRQFEQAGYGTSRTDRWTPPVDPEDVLLMARALVEGEDCTSGR